MITSRHIASSPGGKGGGGNGGDDILQFSFERMWPSPSLIRKNKSRRFISRTVERGKIGGEVGRDRVWLWPL